MWPDRTPHPAIHEVKYLYQPIKVSLEKGTLKITNTQFFETTEGLEFSWPANGDGCELGTGVLSLSLIEPQSSFGIGWKSGPCMVCFYQLHKFFAEFHVCQIVHGL
ncbi:uncharacterized protein LOC133861214 [Alnus glutinosa]|uniref:uncharacterized protein LOC133861214 n=1 Tax=Alnus glutinosa TaxID=3517 RepID=UPI002D76FFBF|nr:uncharacterized protein LOC133861214 [Alnus glutinosa]